MNDAMASEGTSWPMVPSHVRSLRPYEPGKPVEETKRELGISDVLKLASNENSLGPSPKALEAVREHLLESHLYPDDSCFHLKRDLAEALGVTPEEIVIGNGSTELIEILVRTFLSPRGTRPDTWDDEALISDASFLMYSLALQSHGVRFRTIPMKNRTFDLVAMAAAVRPTTKMVFVANPNNPTGTWVDKASMERFLDRLPQHVIPVIDEAYFEYVTEKDYADCLLLRDRHPNLVILRTFSKVHGLAGFRCGYGVMAKRVASFVQRLRAPFNVSSLAQAAARAALLDHAHIEVSRLVNDQGLAFLSAELRRLGLSVTPSVANFLLIDFGKDATSICRQMLRLGVIVRPMAAFGLPTCARITIGTPSENVRALGALKEVVMGSLSPEELQPAEMEVSVSRCARSARHG